MLCVTNRQTDEYCYCLNPNYVRRGLIIWPHTNHSTVGWNKLHTLLDSIC